MTRTLLLRGMLVGIVAGLLVFLCARITGEPEVDRAIAVEAAIDHAQGEPPEPEMVSRRIQKTAGLLTGVIVYGAAMGGIFGLVFAFAYGRIGLTRPRELAVFLAAAGFIAIALVPSLKYPASPPSVGKPETIGLRTAAYFLMMAFSIAAMSLSVQAGRRWSRRFGSWNGSLLAAGMFLVVIGIVAHLLPVIDETPAAFPAELLWRFRLAAWEMQAVLWTTLGLLFGALTERDRQLPQPQNQL
ncbi:CbtA family protein [Granulicella sp. dw_53]|uniref:CbtA family protein n=1 Tax=Granulicella sp. dw_53 TaxID=2719792 RepID=UPI001BD2DAB5|nr:CbtA family protein [Granulicella sp. dw_53]